MNNYSHNENYCNESYGTRSDKDKPDIEVAITNATEELNQLKEVEQADYSMDELLRFSHSFTQLTLALHSEATEVAFFYLVSVR